MINIEILWDDLTEDAQNRIREQLNLDEDDNNNWDVCPMAIMEIEEEAIYD